MIMAPAIKKFMTKIPRTIGEDIPLSKALEMMREFRVRHLPVQYGGNLVGILSDRDVRLALSVYPAAKDLKVGDVMTEDPYAVTVNTPVDKVFTTMARRKYGCVVVKNEKNRAVGILTATDGLRILGDLYRS
jgi:CBS domain-containing protein